METRAIFVLLGLLATAAVSADVWRWVDDEGVVHYSDTPRVGAELVDVSDSSRSTGARVYRDTAPGGSDDPAAEADQAFKYQRPQHLLTGRRRNAMEHRRHAERFIVAEPGAAERPPGAGVLQRRAEAGEQHEFHSRRSSSRRAQHPGGGSRRNGPTDDSQHKQPLLCSAEHGETLGGKSPRRSGDDGTHHTDPKRILDSLSAGVILVDQSLLILDLNPAAENILGISVQRARGESLLRLVDDEPELRDVLSRVLETGDHYANELRLGPTEVHAEERTVDCRVSPLSGGDAAPAR